MNILIFLPNYIGDILQTTPAIRFLKENFLEARIGVVIPEDKKQLLEDNPDVEKLIFKKDFRKLISEVGQFHPEAILLFRTTFSNSLIAGVSRPRFSSGFKEEMSFLFLKKTLRKDMSRSYRYECCLLVEEFFRWLTLREISGPDLKKIIFVGWKTPEIEESVQKKLKPQKVSLQKLIVLNPFSSRKTKMLFPQKYLELIKWLSEKFAKEFSLIVIGSKSERLIAEQMFGNLNIENLAGEMDLKELGYLLSKAKIFITPDSGPAYIAQAVNCPTVMFFTSTLPERFGPYPENVKIVYQPQFCSPCYENECQKDYRCLKNFSLELLEEKILELL